VLFERRLLTIRMTRTTFSFRSSLKFHYLCLFLSLSLSISLSPPPPPSSLAFSLSHTLSPSLFFFLSLCLSVVSRLPLSLSINRQCDMCVSSSSLLLSDASWCVAVCCSVLQCVAVCCTTAHTVKVITVHFHSVGCLQPTPSSE